MTGNAMELSFRVTGDASSGIKAFTELKKGVGDAQKAFDEATTRVAELAKQIREAEKPSAALNLEFAKAKREAGELKEAFLAKRNALEQSRRSLTAAGVDVKNLASEYRRLAAESKAAAAAQSGAAAAKAAGQERANLLGSLGVRPTADIQREISATQQTLQRLAADARVSGEEFDRAFAAGQKRIASLKGEMHGAMDPLTASVARATGGVGELSTALRPLQAAFAAITAGIGVREILRAAEVYGEMTAKIRLATKYTGDFAEVQAGLQKSAKDTRTPLADTVNLYSQLAPSLTQIGVSGNEAVGVVTTVSQAVALSGAAAQNASAGMLQFAQMVGGGTARLEEWNSLVENVPAVADAIAEGFGKTRGEMRKLIESGAISSEEIVRSLQKVSKRVDEDFGQMPTKIGQAMTLVNNEFTVFVGRIDESLGATQTLANGIKALSENLELVARISIPLIAAATVPLVARLGVMTATAVKAAIALAAVNPVGAVIGVAAATAAYFALDKVLENVAEKAEKTTVEETARKAEETAKARLKVEQDLAREIERLENLRKVAAGTANANILLDDKQLQQKRIEEARKATEKQLEGIERLRDALRTAWETAIEGARRAREEAAGLMQQAGEARQAGIDKANERLMRGMTPEERGIEAGRQARDLRDQASGSASRAVIKAFEGDLKNAQKLAEAAANQAERAERFVDQIGDDRTAANLSKELGEIREQALRAQAQIKQREAQQQEETGRALGQEFLNNEQRIVALKAELAKPVTIQLDITAAEQRIKVLQAQLAKLGGQPGAADTSAPGASAGTPTAAAGLDKTTTVTAETTQAENALGEVKSAVDAIPEKKQVVVESILNDWTTSTGDAASNWNAKQNRFATGGFVRGPGNGTSDSILARLSNGEFVVRAAAVRHYGADLLTRLNGLSLPRFAEGGLVSSGVLSVAEPGGGSNTPIVLDLGQLGRHETSARQDVADELVRVFQRAALQRGRRS